MMQQQPMMQQPMMVQPGMSSGYYWSYLAQPQTGNPLIDLFIGISSGKVPSNELIHEIGDISREVLEAERFNAGLDKSTQKTARSLEALIESFQRLLESKNPDEMFQKFIIDSNIASRNLASQAKTMAPGSEDRAKASLHAKDLNETARGTLTLFGNVLQTLIKSHTFRSLLLDALKLFEDIATQQHSTRQKSASEKKSFSFSQQTYQGQGPSGFSGQPLGMGPSGFSGQPMGGYSTIYNSNPVGGPFYGASNLYGPAIFEQQGMSQSGLYGGQVGSQDPRRGELAQRFRSILERLSDNQDFVDALRGIFLLVDNVSAIQTNKVTAFNPSKDPQMQLVWNDAKEILYRFVGKKSLDNFLDHSWLLCDSVRKDPEATNLFRDLRQFIMSSLQNPSSLRDSSHVRQSEDLITRTRTWMQRSEYKARVTETTNDLRLMLEVLKHDEAAVRFNKDLCAFGSGILYDPLTGNINFNAAKTSLLQFKSFLAPLILRHLDVIHIPRISGENPSVEWLIEDLIIHGRDIIPDHISFHHSSEGDMHLRKRKKAEYKSYMTMTINHWALHAHGFRFYYRTLTGMKLMNEGIADLDMGGHRSALVLVWKVKSKNGIVKFSVHDVICHMSKFKIRILKSRHSLRDKVGIALMKGSLKKKIETSIVHGLAGAMAQMNTKLNQMFVTSEQLPFIKTKYEKGAYGIPEFAAPSQTETYIASDPFVTRFGKATTTY